MNAQTQGRSIKTSWVTQRKRLNNKSSVIPCNTNIGDVCTRQWLRKRKRDKTDSSLQDHNSKSELTPSTNEKCVKKMTSFSDNPASRERSGAVRGTRRSPSPGASGGSKGLVEPDLPKRLTGQSKDVGPTGRHVTAVNREVIEHVTSTSFA